MCELREGNVTIMSVLDELNWSDVRSHYDARFETHQELLLRYRRNQRADYVGLALGIEDAVGNYSAEEHGLGAKILASNDDAVNEVYNLATALLAASSPRLIPSVIQKAHITYLAVGVGSELACMLAPDRYWVTNSRTLWTYLLFKHGENKRTANEALILYLDNDERSNMYYPKWTALHRDVGPSMRSIAALADAAARANGVNPGPVAYLWADAVSSFLYSLRND